MTGTDTQSSLRNRFSRIENQPVSKSTEELLIEKLDKFLSSIESSLDNFEQFFKLDNEELFEKDEQEHNEAKPRSRRSSNASLSSIKTFSINNLNMVHQRLNIIKDSVLKASFTNLEYLYLTLDDQYNYLFNSSNSSEAVNTSLELNSKEILSQKIITTIQYFDEKLIQIDNFIKDNKPKAKIDYNLDATFNQLRFYNFNRALKKAQNGYLHYYDLPLSWRENRYIIHGYRFSLKHSSMIKSIFHFNHNETVNIWTHVIGFILLSYICLWHYPNSEIYKINEFKDNLVMYVFLGAAMKCLISSVIWHAYSCFAHLPTRTKCACVDYTGITVLITCSVISAEYCLLYNYPNLLNIYIIFSAICGLTGFIFNWSPYFDKPECRSLRIGFFMGLAFLGLTAFFCSCFYEGFMKSFKFFLPLAYKSFIWYWLGVVFYGGLIPERWRYDVIINEDETCNHSHDSSDVLTCNIEHSGKEEIEEIEEEIEEIEEQHLQDDEEESKFREVIDKHFPLKPITTPYHKDFLSLWWVDYFLSSHNIWHICVVLGIVGHYSTILEMFHNIERL